MEPHDDPIAQDEFDADVAPEFDPAQVYRHRYALLASLPHRSVDEEAEMQALGELLSARGYPVDSIPVLWRPEGD